MLILILTQNFVINLSALIIIQQVFVINLLIRNQTNNVLNQTILYFDFLFRIKKIYKKNKKFKIIIKIKKKIIENFLLNRSKKSFV